MLPSDSESTLGRTWAFALAATPSRGIGVAETVAWVTLVLWLRPDHYSVQSDSRQTADEDASVQMRNIDCSNSSIRTPATLICCLLLPLRPKGRLTPRERQPHGCLLPQLSFATPREPRFQRRLDLMLWHGWHCRTATYKTKQVPCTISTHTDLYLLSSRSPIMSTMTSLLSLLVALIASVGAIDSACTKSPYTQILFLSSYQPAVSFCSSKFPIPTPTCIAFATVTNTLSTTVSVCLWKLG